MPSQQNNKNKPIAKSKNRNSKPHVGGDDVVGNRFIKAAKAGDTQRLLLRLTNGVDVGYRDDRGLTALHLAALNRNTDCVQMLIDHGANVHAQSNAGHYVIHAAAQGGSIECVQLLHSLGVDINAKTALGNTAYDIAKQNGKTKTADLLQQLSDNNPNTSQHNIDEDRSIIEPDSISMEIDEHTKTSSTVTSEQKKVKQNQCHRCQCNSYTTKDNQLNDLLQENIQLKRKMANNEQQTEKREAEIKRQKSALETRVMSIDKLKQDNDGLQKEHAAFKERISSLRQENIELVSTQEKQLACIESLKEENAKLKVNVAAIENRLVSLEQREHGQSGLPLVVTTMAGFDFGNLVGKDFMHPDMQQIFSQATFEAFKNHSEPQLIAEYMWTNNVITEKQYQEIKGQSTVIGKAEYIWSLMKLERRYLEAVREALRVTNQDALASKLQ